MLAAAPDNCDRHARQPPEKEPPRLPKTPRVTPLEWEAVLETPPSPCAELSRRTGVLALPQRLERHPEDDDEPRHAVPGCPFATLIVSGLRCP
jgi:hypothetical protein